MAVNALKSQNTNIEFSYDFQIPFVWNHVQLDHLSEPCLTASEYQHAYVLHWGRAVAVE
jgi:hypothetical protein